MILFYFSIRYPPLIYPVAWSGNLCIPSSNPRQRFRLLAESKQHLRLSTFHQLRSSDLVLVLVLLLLFLPSIHRPTNLPLISLISRLYIVLWWYPTSQSILLRCLKELSVNYSICGRSLTVCDFTVWKNQRKVTNKISKTYSNVITTQQRSPKQYTIKIRSSFTSARIHH